MKRGLCLLVLPLLIIVLGLVGLSVAIDRYWQHHILIEPEWGEPR